MTKNFKKLTAITLATIMASLCVAQVANAREGKVKVKGANGTFAAGSKGGSSYARGHGVTQNADGAYVAANGQAFKAANGATAAHAGSTTFNQDGSATHQGGLTANGAYGSAVNQNTAYKNADGTYGANSNSTITSNKTGNIYNGTTSYDSTSGVSHSYSCTDASGATIACPTRN